MTAFDSFLDFIVPVLVILGMLWILYKPFSKPINALGSWIKGIVQGKDETEEPFEGGYTTPVIRRNLDFE